MFFKKNNPTNLHLIPKISIIVVAYKRYKEIAVLIHSFLAQTVQDFKLHIIHDGYDGRMDKLLKPYKKQYPHLIDYEFTKHRYNDYGHSLRDIGIQKATGDYILLTNDDNYYCPKFVEYMNAALKEEQADVVLFDMIHSHSNPGGRAQPPYCFFETAPQRFSVDIGCFIVRTPLAKQVGFRDKTHDGDATYFEDIMGLVPTPHLIKVPRVLLVHN